MNEDNKILTEIMESVSQIPYECKERIRDVVNGMAYTRRILVKSQPQQTA